ncbi:MAG: hypothetical protein MJ252_08935 [archaeon]|nr:hypothetical protein [archaeon]
MSPTICIKTLAKSLGERVNYFTTCLDVNDFAQDEKRELFLLPKKEEVKEDPKINEEEEKSLLGKVGSFKSMLTEKSKDMMNKLADSSSGMMKKIGIQKEENVEASQVSPGEDKEVLVKETGEELLLVTESSVIFVGMNYNKGMRDKIIFERLNSIEVQEFKDTYQINFKGISEYDYRKWEIENPEMTECNKLDMTYSYKTHNGKYISRIIRELYEIYYFTFHKKHKQLPYKELNKNEESEEQIEPKNELQKQLDPQLEEEEIPNVEEEEEEEEESGDEGDNGKVEKIYVHKYDIPPNFKYNGYSFNLPPEYKEDLINPGTYYLEAERRKNAPLPYQTKIKIYVNEEMPIESLDDNSTLNSLKYQAIGNLSNYMGDVISDLGVYYPEPMIKFKIVNSEEEGEDFNSSISDYMEEESKKEESIQEETYLPNSEWKGYKMTVRTKPEISTKIGYKVLYCYLRRKFIPPFYDSFNDIVIMVIENFSNEKGNYFFSAKTLETFDNIIKTLTPMHIIEANTLTNQMIDNKIDAYMIDGKSLKFFKKYKFMDLDKKESSIVVNEFRVKMNILREKYSERETEKNLDQKALEEKEEEKLFFERFYKETEKSLGKGKTNFIIDEYKKDLVFRGFNEIVKFPEKKFEKLFKKKDRQCMELYELKVKKFVCQNFVEKVYHYRVLPFILELAKTNEEFFEEVKEGFNILIGFHYLDYENQVETKVNIEKIVREQPKIQELFFNEKFLCTLISNNLLEKAQNVKSHVTYFNFLKFILENKFSYKLINSVAEYLELLIKESPHLKGKTDLAIEEFELKTTIGNTEILVPVILNIFTRYSKNPLITTISLQCLQNLILLDGANMNYFLQFDDFFSFLGQHLLSSDNSIVYNAIYLIALLTKKRYDQTVIYSNNVDLLIKLVNIFKGLDLSTHNYHPEIILLLLKYFTKLVKNSHVWDVLDRPKNKKFIGFILKYLSNYEDSFNETDNCNLYYFDINIALFDFLNYYSDIGLGPKQYLASNYRIIEMLNKRLGEFNIIIQEVIKNKKLNKTLITLLDYVLIFLKEFTGNDEKRVQSYKTKNVSVCKFVELCRDYSKPVLERIKQNMDKRKDKDNKILEMQNKLISQLEEIIGISEELMQIIINPSESKK